MYHLLPSELICTIFHELQLHDRINAAQTCSSWRTASLGDSKLWCKLSYGHRGALSMVGLAGLLTRARLAPVVLSPVYLSATDAGPILRLITSHMHHILDISLQCETSKELTAVAAQLLQPAPILEGLILAISQEIEPIPDDSAILPACLFKGHCPRLVAATIVGLRIPATCAALTNVTRLMLVPPPPQQSSPPVCLTDIMPKIDTLRITVYPQSPQLQYTLGAAHNVRTLVLLESGNSKYVSHGEMRPHLASLGDFHQIAHISVSEADAETAGTLLDDLASQPERITVSRDDGHRPGRVEASVHSRNGSRSRGFMDIHLVYLCHLMMVRHDLAAHVLEFHCVDYALRLLTRVIFPRLESLHITIGRRQLLPTEYFTIFSGSLSIYRTPRLHTLRLDADPTDGENGILLDSRSLIAALQERGGLKRLHVDGLVLAGCVEDELVSLVDELDVVLFDRDSQPQRFQFQRSGHVHSYPQQNTE